MCELKKEIWKLVIAEMTPQFLVLCNTYEGPGVVPKADIKGWDR